MGHTAILGGTGPEGMGLALRLALCGDEIVIGSRRAERAAAAAAKAVQRLGDAGGAANVRGAENAAAVDGAEVVVLAFPYAGVAETVPPLAAQLAGKLVVDVVNPLVLKDGIFRVEPPPAGSAAEEIQRLLPQSRVVGAFKNESAQELQRIEEPLRGDVLDLRRGPARPRRGDATGRAHRRRAPGRRRVADQRAFSRGHHGSVAQPEPAPPCGDVHPDPRPAGRRAAPRLSVVVAALREPSFAREFLMRPEFVIAAKACRTERRKSDPRAFSATCARWTQTVEPRSSKRF